MSKISEEWPQRLRGGQLVIDSFAALGADVIFGEPGQHALPMWEGLRNSTVRYVGLRTELDAAFAADGYARVAGKPAPLLLSTGPGALISLAGLMEAANSAVPIVAVLAQIPSDGLGGRRKGFVHELDDQLASFSPIVKRTYPVRHASVIPDVLAEAYRLAHTAPHGPVVVEIPVDVLADEVNLPAPLRLDGLPAGGPPVREDVAERVSTLLQNASSVVMIAGGGLVRSGAFDEFALLATTLNANVVTTHTGRGSFPEDHPLFAGATGDDAAVNELIGAAEVVLCFGSKIGEETSGHFSLKISGTLIQVDPEPRNIGTNYAAIPFVADAKEALHALLDRVGTPSGSGRAESNAVAAKDRIQSDLIRQGRGAELAVMDVIRKAWPEEAVTAWDMTILGYWSTQYFPVLNPRTYIYPHGSGSLGYAMPAAIGAAAAQPSSPVLAVVGDGGSMYGLSTLAVAKQYNLQVRFLISNNNAYGVLREYQMEDFGVTHGVELEQPDFAALCTAFGVPVRTATPDTLGEQLDWALQQDGPAAVVLAATPVMFQPTA
ncbi:MAG: thiamine pyrophosphate-binding protein [Mycobacterium sp.]